MYPQTFAVLEEKIVKIHCESPLQLRQIICASFVSGEMRGLVESQKITKCVKIKEYPTNQGSRMGFLQGQSSQNVANFTFNLLTLVLLLL